MDFISVTCDKIFFISTDAKIIKIDYKNKYREVIRMAISASLETDVFLIAYLTIFFKL